MFRYLFALFTINFSAVACAIDIDGFAGEPEWRQAQALEEFYVVQPFLLNEPEFRTEAKIHSDTQGIYLAITSFQEESLQQLSHSAKDEKIKGDSVLVAIDFDAKGKKAYVFELANGSGLRDGVLSHDTSYDREWNGDWLGASQSQGDRWVAELFIPWSAVPMVKGRQKFRQVGVYVQRHVAHSRLRVASSPFEISSERFLANLPWVEVANRKESSKFKLTAYGVAEADLLNDENELQPGAEAYWKSEDNQQHLALGLQPNFVGVAPDKLVLNFTPLEVFFPERRAFFADNNRVFDLRGNRDLRLIYSRRIGGPNGINPEFNDTDFAMKYSDTGGALNLGVLAANEGDSDVDSGKSFVAGRVAYQWGKVRAGLLSTYVERTEQERKAQTHSMDLTYEGDDALVVNGLISISNVDEQPLGSELNGSELSGSEISDSEQGMGVSLRASQQISNSWIHQFDFMRYEEDYQVNDLGFLPRANLQGFRYRSILNSLDSQSHNLEFSTEVLDNISGLDLYRTISMEYGRSLRNSALWKLVASYRSPGHDDLITRGNLAMKTEEGFLFGALWQGKSRERLYYQLEANYQDMPIEGKGYYAAIKPGINLSERLALHMDIVYLKRQEWNIWQVDNLVNSFEREQFYTDLNFIARISDKQNLQFNLQWIALGAKAEFAGELARNGALIADEREIDDFNVADTAFQLRYSYQLSPQAEALLVYRRAGHYGENYLGETEQDQRGYGSAFGTFPNSWRERSLDNLLVKLSWVF